MTRKDWVDCVRQARASGFSPINYLSLHTFFGMALDNSRRTATKEEVASLIFGHCATFGGTWLSEEERDLEALYPRIDLVG